MALCIDDLFLRLHKRGSSVLRSSEETRDARISFDKIARISRQGVIRYFTKEIPDELNTQILGLQETQGLNVGNSNISEIRVHLGQVAELFETFSVKKITSEEAHLLLMAATDTRIAMLKFLDAGVYPAKSHRITQDL